MERHEWEKALVDIHESYSRCMARLYRFKRAEGEDYGIEFAKRLKRNYGEVQDLEECRVSTKDYWKQVRAYCTRFGCIKGDYRVDDWNANTSALLRWWLT